MPYSIASTKHFNQTSPTLQTFARTDNLPQTPGPWNRLKSSPAFWFEPLAELFACTYRRAWLFGFTPGIGAPVSNYPRTWFKVHLPSENSLYYLSWITFESINCLMTWSISLWCIKKRWREKKGVFRNILNFVLMALNGPQLFLLPSFSPFSLLSEHRGDVEAIIYNIRGY